MEEKKLNARLDITKRAQKAIRTTLALGFNLTWLSKETGYSNTSVTRARQKYALVCEEAMLLYEKAARTAFAERCKSIILPECLVLLDLCTHRGVKITKDIQEELCKIAAEHMACGLSLDPLSKPFPDKIQGGTFGLGDSVILIVVPSQCSSDESDKEANQIQVKIHELEHVEQRGKYQAQLAKKEIHKLRKELKKCQKSMPSVIYHSFLEEG